jgi:undecaprenyl-diphosphatase
MEQEFFQMINGGQWPAAWDVLMASLSSWAVWWPLAVVLGLVVVWRGGWRGRVFVLSAAMAVGVNDGLVCNPLKKAVERPRPHQVLEGVRKIDLAKASPRLLAVAMPLKVEFSGVGGVDARGRSFPSSHAANCFALATVVAVFWRRWGWLAYVPAGLVAWSRLHVGSHWPVDVLAGVVVGVVVALAVLGILRWLWRVVGPRVLPRWHAAHPEWTGP